MQWDFNNLRSRLVEFRSMPPSGAESDLELQADCQRLVEMIDAMTPEERANPDLLQDRVRQLRIAEDTGSSLEDVAELIRQQQGMAAMFRRKL